MGRGRRRTILLPSVERGERRTTRACAGGVPASLEDTVDQVPSLKRSRSPGCKLGGGGGGKSAKLGLRRPEGGVHQPPV